MKKLIRKTEMLLHSFIVILLLCRTAEILTAHLYFPGFILSLLCCAIVLLSVFWKRLSLPPRSARLSCYYLESIAFLVNWIIFSQQHEASLAQSSLMAAVIFPFFGYVTSIKTHRSKKRTSL